MAITKQTVKIYSKTQLETFGLVELKAIAGNYSRLLDRDCTPSKYGNRKSAWMEAIELAQTTWKQQQSPAVPETLFDLSAYSQPQSTHQGLSEYQIDTANATVDPYWDDVAQDLQGNTAATGAVAAEGIDSEQTTVLADNEKRSEPQEICRYKESDEVREALSPEEIIEKVYRHIDCQYENGDRQTILSDAGGMDGLLTLLRHIEPSITDELASQVLARFAAGKPLIATLGELKDGKLVLGRTETDFSERIELAAASERTSTNSAPVPASDRQSQSAEEKSPVLCLDAGSSSTRSSRSKGFKLRPNINEYIERSLLLDRAHKADESGQLSLFDLEEEEKEAPDPDDFPSNEAYESAWKEWIATHTEQPGFCSPDAESAIAPLAHNTEGDSSEEEESDEGAIAPEKSPAADDDDDDDAPIRFTSKPRIHPSPITRSEAAAALGISEERVIKDPTPTLNCCVVVYLDDQGKKRSQFVSYRRFEFWTEQLKDAIDAASPEAIQAVEERMLRELIDFQRHYPHKFQNELRLALRRKKEFLFPEVSKKSSNKKAIAV